MNGIMLDAAASSSSPSLLLLLSSSSCSPVCSSGNLYVGMSSVGMSVRSTSASKSIARSLCSYALEARVCEDDGR